MSSEPLVQESPEDPDRKAPQEPTLTPYIPDRDKGEDDPQPLWPFPVPWETAEKETRWY